MKIKNELIIYWNHGVEKISLVNFFFLISFIILIIQIVLLTYIAPKSQEIARGLLRNSDVDYFEGLIKPKKFNDNIKGLTIFAQDKNEKEEFINIYIKKRTNQNSFQVTFAKKGIFEQSGKSKILVLYDGHSLNNNDNKITNFSFSKSDFRLGEMESHSPLHRKLQEQPTKEILKCLESIFFNQKVNILNCNKSKPKNVYKELFKRFITPFYLPLLILISAINLIISKENINYSKFRFSIFLIGIFTIIISESTLGFIDNTFTKNIFFILLPILSILAIYSILVYKVTFKKAKI